MAHMGGQGWVTTIRQTFAESSVTHAAIGRRAWMSESSIQKVPRPKEVLSPNFIEFLGSLHGGGILEEAESGMTSRP